MLPELYFSGNWLMDILVLLDQFWYLFTALFVPSTYYIFLKIFAFPLITRKSHEFIIVATPENVKIKKAISHITPFFAFKNGLYWFSNGFKDRDSQNRYVVYCEGINQAVTEVQRNRNKLHDVLYVPKLPKQVAAHKILVPTKLRDHLKRHYLLTINTDDMSVRLEPTKERQPLRVSFYHTLGIQIEYAQQVGRSVELEAAAGKTMQVQLTAQLVMSYLKITAETRNFSSGFAYDLWRRVNRSLDSIVRRIEGSIDPKIIILLMVMLGLGAAIFLIFYLSSPETILGPMPT
jgi:hypothetical protein